MVAQSTRRVGLTVLDRGILEAYQWRSIARPGVACNAAAPVGSNTISMCQNSDKIPVDTLLRIKYIFMLVSKDCGI